MTRSSWLLSFALLLLAGFPAVVNGQAAWEYTPYQIRVWVALDSVPQLPSALIPLLADSLSARSSAVLGAVVQMQVAAAPAKLRGSLLNDLDGVSAEAIAAAADPIDLEADKIYLAVVTRRLGEPRIRLRELDVRSRQLGTTIERTCGGMSRLSLALCDVISESFTPLGRIEQVDDRKFTLRLRAGGLIIDPASP
ncbi:MAG: hypothetical protein JF612_01465, partial [Planctomycetia bacterium]|nr:hypothetical protein [Planctomycetia bacterium]